MSGWEAVPGGLAHPSLPGFVWQPPPGAADTDGDRCVRFAETLCRQTRGRRAGSVLALRAWQRQIICDVLALDADGVRMYRRGLLGLPRKNGKSEVGAILALYFLALDGEYGAEVYSCAGDRGQARVVFDQAKAVIAAEPLLRDKFTVTRDLVAHPRTRSRYAARSAEAYSAEGLNPSACLFDEVHVQPNARLWDVMSLGSGTRERPLILGITTAGYDKASLCGALYDAGRRGTEGMYFRWWEPESEGADLRDPTVWRTCNPGLDLAPAWQAYHQRYAATGSHVEARAAAEAVDADYLDAPPRPDFLSLADMRMALPPSTSENAFRRYRLNQWTETLEAWLPAGAWAACAAPRALEDGEEVVLFLDGSFSGDSTALVACTFDGHLAVVGHWERPDGPLGDGWRVDILEVEARAVELAGQYRVIRLGVDPFRWQRSEIVLREAGLPVEEFPTTSVKRMVPACAALYDAIVEGRVTHDGSPDLARHLANAVVKTDRNGPRIVKEHKMSTKRIDLAVAAVGAYTLAMTPRDPDEGDWEPHLW